MKNFKSWLVALATSLAIALPTDPSHAEDSFPSHTVKMVVPYPAGGGTDLLARVLANELSRKWSQSVIVENVGGAGGNIGASQVARADAGRLYAAVRLAGSRLDQSVPVQADGLRPGEMGADFSRSQPRPMCWCCARTSMARPSRM